LLSGTLAHGDVQVDVVLLCYIYPLVPDHGNGQFPKLEMMFPLQSPLIVNLSWQDLALVFFWPSWVSLKMGKNPKQSGYPMGNVMVIFHGIYKWYFMGNVIWEYGIWDEFENG